MSLPTPDRVWLGIACLGAGALALCGLLLFGDLLKRVGRRRLTGLLGTQRTERRPAAGPRLVEEVLELGRTRTRTWALLALAAGAGGLAGGVLLDSPLGMAPGALLALWALGGHARRRLADRGRQVRQRLPDVLLGLASCLRSGQSLVQAVEVVGVAAEGPLEKAFRRALEDYRAGTPLLRALRKLAERFPGDDVTYFLQALEIHRLSGGNLAEVLANAAAALNERRALKGELDARTAEARLSAQILLALPVILGLYFWWSNREMLRPLWETPAGRIGAGYAVLSWLAGREFMHRLVASVKP